MSRQVDSQNEACITVIGTNKQQLIFNQHDTGKQTENKKTKTENERTIAFVFTSVILYHLAKS